MFGTIIGIYLFDYILAVVGIIIGAFFGSFWIWRDFSLLEKEIKASKYISNDLL